MAQVNLSISGPLLVEVLPYVFKGDTTELLNRALVCKLWKEAAYSNTLKEMIRPSRTMSIREMKKINAMIVSHESEETHMPFEVFKNIAEKEKAGLKDWWLVYKPSSVKVINDEGKIEEVPLKKLKAIGNVCNTAFTGDTWPLALEDEREEKSHWVWIELEALGFSMKYEKQLDTAKSEDKKAYPERYPATATNSDKVGSKNKAEVSEPKQIVNMADVNDLALGMLMAKALFNEIPFSWDPATWKGMMIRTKTMTIDESGYKRPIMVCVAPSGLDVSDGYGYAYVSDGYGYAYVSVGFVCARRSLEFETLPFG